MGSNFFFAFIVCKIVIIYPLVKCMMVIQLVMLGARPPESIEPPLAPPNTVPPQVEELIMWAFGKAIIEFEATLYHKFHLLSGDIVVGRNEFRWHLQNMEERGILASSEYKGVPSWSRLK